MKIYETMNEMNWRKGNQEWQIGTGCVLYHLGYSRWEMRERLDSAARLLFPERIAEVRLAATGQPIIDLNDHPDTTLDDMLRVCKLADV